jgi:tetratricopeptide (TPR) repeat protein
MQHPSPHFDSQEWIQALSSGRFDSSERHVTARHVVVKGCKHCLAALQEVVKQSELLGDEEKKTDSIALTLRDWVRMRQQMSRVKDFHPAYGYWLDRQHFKPVDDPVPDRGLLRAILERGRQTTIEDPNQAVVATWRALEDVVDANFSFEDKLGYDLCALAQTYCAEAYQRVRKHYEASACLRAAEEYSAKGSGDREIRGSLLEVQAVVAPWDTVLDPATALQEAVKLFADCPIPGRRSEVRLRYGIALMARGWSEAKTELRIALEALPPPDDVYPRLRLEILHHLAAAEAQSGDFKGTLRHLALAEELYRQHPLEPMATQRQWLIGVSYFHTGRIAQAEAPLRQALDSYYELCEWDGAVHAMLSLGKLFVVEKRFKEFLQLEQEFSGLIQSVTADEQAITKLREAVRLGDERGVQLRYLQETLVELEEGRKSAVN